MNDLAPCGPPPSFAEAHNRRQKARAAGLHPDYWYAVEYDRALKRGQTLDVEFWNRSIALFRDENNIVHAIENRCAHRQVKLSLGEVKGCHLVCAYHGWTYDGEGRVIEIPHDLFGRSTPHFKVQSYPVRVRYGLIWIFPGNRALAEQKSLPEIPELEGKRRWACVPIDFTWNAHHSIIIDNVSDFTHAHLHRSYRPFTDAKLTSYDASGDKVSLSYDTKVGQGRISGLFVDRQRVRTDHMDLCFDYPYQRSNTDDRIKHWCFFLPRNLRCTRVFFLFYFEALKIPFLPIQIPQQCMTLVLKIANRVLIRPLLSQDGSAVEAEQTGYEKHWDAPLAELNPVIGLFQQLIVRRWQEYLDETSPRDSISIEHVR
jgi:phenylpropionate dioxygenase-like ring-hydroxylating dioxygenase large terminal subunit